MKHQTRSILLTIMLIFLMACSESKAPSNKSMTNDTKTTGTSEKQEEIGFLQVMTNTIAEIAIKDNSGKTFDTRECVNRLAYKIPAGSYVLSASDSNMTYAKEIEVIADKYQTIMFNFLPQKSKISKDANLNEDKTGFIQAWASQVANIVIKDSSGEIYKVWDNVSEIDFELSVGYYEIIATTESMTIINTVKINEGEYFNITFSL